MLEREGRSGAAIQRKSFDAPDDVRRFPKGIVDLVHVGSGIMALGRASEIIASSVTRGLVEGRGFAFRERGSHKLKGLESPIEVFMLAT